MKKKWVLLLLATLVFYGFKRSNKQHITYPGNWPAPAYNFSSNPLTPEKLALGRALFYDPILSTDSTISCASCHLQYTGFTHVDHSLSHGIAGRIGTRNSPTLINLAWGSTFMWDGAVNHLDAQALAPISNVLEMDEQITNVVHKLQRTSKYRQMFHAAWNDSTVTGAHTLQSIGAFLASIVSCNSRYDKMKNGLDTFSGKEQRGYLLFRQHCNSCHTEPLFTNNSFENNGLSIDTTLNDIGRARISLKKDDSFKFKVPTLRNIAFSFPYMHDGRFKTLGQVLNHYSNGVVNSQTLSTSLKHGLQLTSDEKVEIIAFLLTLTDRQFLFDERYGYPVTKVNGQ